MVELRRRTRPLAIALLGAALIAGCSAPPLATPSVVPSGGDRIGPTQPGGPSASPPSATPVPSARTWGTQGSSLLTIAFDPVHSMIWFVTGNDAGAPVLRGVTAATGAVNDVRLPGGGSSEYIGEFSPLRVDPSGAVWLANNDRLVRYDPATGKLSSITFDAKVVGALPGATSGSLQGTWPSGLGFLDGRTLLARANVPWLTAFDATLREVARIPIPPIDAGAKDLIATASGDLLLLPWNDLCVTPGRPIAVLGARGAVLGQIAVGGDHLYPLGGSILVSGGPGGANVVTGTTVLPVLPNPGPYCSLHADVAAPDPRGGVTLFLRGGGPGGLSELEHVVDQNVVSAVTFPPVDISNAPKPPPGVAADDDLVLDRRYDDRCHRHDVVRRW